MTWIRPSFSTQLANGNYNFRVGRFGPGLAVDADVTYFREDGAYSADLTDPVNFVLDVCETSDVVQGPWILDVCLDYFACLDPFEGRIDERRQSPLPVGGATDPNDVDVRVLTDLLERSKTTPCSVITIARSARDGYTPTHIVDAIESKVLSALTTAFPDLVVHRDHDGIGPPSSDLNWLRAFR